MIKKILYKALCMLLLCGNFLHGTWDPPAQVALPPSNTPKVDVSSSGRAVAVFVSFGAPIVIRAATLEYCDNLWVPSTAQLSGTGDSFMPQVGVDANGNAVAIWIESFAPAFIRGATLAAGSNTWTAATTLPDLGQVAGSPRVAMDANGNATAIWADQAGASIAGATLLAGQTIWQATNSPTFLPSTVGYVPNPSLVMNTVQSVAVFQEFDGVTHRISGATLSSGSNIWTTTIPLETSLFDLRNPQVALDSAGNAVAVWEADVLGISVIHGAILPVGSTAWTPTLPLTTINNASLPQVVIDPSGRAVAIYVINDGVNTQIASSVLPAGSNTWTPITDPSILGTNGSPQLAIDDAGNATAIWNSGTTLQSADLPVGGSVWSAVTNLSPNSTATAVGAGKANYAVATWGEDGGIRGAHSTITAAESSTVVAVPTIVPNDGVTTSTITVTLQNCSGPLVGHTVTLAAGSGSSVISAVSGPSDALGQVTFTVTDLVAETVTYTATDVTDSVVIFETANVTFVSSITPPLPSTNFISTNFRNRFLTQTDLINVLTFTKSTDPTVVAYRIYENGIVIAVLPSTSPAEVLIHNRRKKISYRYTIVSVNADGIESTPVTIVSEPF